MSQRNFMNERYNDENRTGKTRRSASSAKPKAERAAMEKNDYMQSRFEETEGYKRLRRIWWVLLVGAILCTALSFVFQRNEGLQQFSLPVMIAAYVLIVGAFYIDLGKIRKERKLYNAALVSNKSKEARREQKRLKAEKRAQEKEAAEKFEAAKAEEEAKRESGFFSRFRKKDKAPSAEEGVGKVEEGKGDSSAS